MMNKFFIALSVLVLSINTVKAQDFMHIVAGVEGGWIGTSYNNKSSDSKLSLIGSEKGNYTFRGLVSFLMTWQDFSAELGVSQSLRYWTMEGNTLNSSVVVRNKQSFPSVFTGANYQISLISGGVNLLVYGGTQFSVDFVNYNSLKQTKGVKSDFVVATTEESSKVALNVIPEIGIKGYFDDQRGNFWQLGVRYNYPLSGDTVNGSIQHYLGGKLQKKESVSYKADGTYISLVFRYGFMLRN